MKVVPSQPFENLVMSDVPVPPWWVSRLEQIEAFIEATANPRQVHILATSSGGRPVRYVAYGEGEPHLRGTANFNSALGAKKPDAYFRRGKRRRPVLMILAGVHGGEVEGMMAALSAISMLETGVDLAGKDQTALADALRRLRLIIVPVANPDGRVRVPYDGWVGRSVEEMHRISQGTRPDGSSYGWPRCKAVHPMKAGDVQSLGGYFDDAGVNMMHDEWSAPMSQTSSALLQLVRQEGPDIVLNLHGHECPAAMLSLAYVPQAVKEDLLEFTSRLYERYDETGLPHGPLPEAQADGPRGTVPPALNLSSMMYHTGAALPMTFETPQGLAGRDEMYTYAKLLQIHHIVFETAAEWLLKPQSL